MHLFVVWQGVSLYACRLHAIMLSTFGYMPDVVIMFGVMQFFLYVGANLLMTVSNKCPDEESCIF